MILGGVSEVVGLLDVVARVQAARLVVVPDVAAEAVAPRLRDDVDLPAAVAPELDAVRVLHDLELRHRLGTICDVEIVTEMSLLSDPSTM